MSLCRLPCTPTLTAFINRSQPASTSTALATLHAIDEEKNIVEKLMFAPPALPHVLHSHHITVYTSLQPNRTSCLTSTCPPPLPAHRRRAPRASARPKTDRFYRSHKNSKSCSCSLKKRRSSDSLLIVLCCTAYFHLYEHCSVCF